MVALYISVVVVVVVQGILWITTKKAMNMAREAVDKFVGNPSRLDTMTPILLEMSTADLALCLVLLSRELRAARAARDDRQAMLLADRLGRVEREVESRQMRMEELLP